MYEDLDTSGFSRPDLVRYVLDHCVELPVERIKDLQAITSWCEERFGEERPGSILSEAMEGWLDYFDGDWCGLFDELDRSKYLFWFFRKEDRALFTLTWL